MDNQSNNVMKDFSYLLLLVGSFITIGFVFIYSASAIYAHEYLGNPYYFFMKQLLKVIVALGAAWLFYLIPISFWKKHLDLFLGFSWVLAALFLIPQCKTSMHGTDRLLLFNTWSLLPNELIKLFTPMFLGHFLSKKDPQQWSFYEYTTLGMLYLFFLMVLLRQPDVITASIILITTLAVCFVARCRILFLVSALVGAGVLFWAHFASVGALFSGVKRLFFPWTGLTHADPEVLQSMMAISSGGWWGSLMTYTKQKFFYIPGVQSDYIFALLSEEVGFFGSLCLLSMYLLFALFGFRVVRRLRDGFTAYTTLGFVITILLQASVHFLAALGVIYAPGIGLPFMSFSSSSLVIMGGMVGFLLQGVRKEQWADDVAL